MLSSILRGVLLQLKWNAQLQIANTGILEFWAPVFVGGFQGVECVLSLQQAKVVRPEVGGASPET